jgi:membrane associated rhomboid family serine protease
MTTVFLIITIIVSLVAFQNDEVYRKLIFNPYLVNSRREYYRFFSSGFIHADFVHLFVNMFVLYSFGSVAEFFYNIHYGDRGPLLFVIMYLSALLMSLIPTYNRNKLNPAYNGLGASGAVSAVVFTCILFDPIQPLALYGFIRLPGIVFGILYLVYCYYMGKKGGDNINHSAHMWGAIYGMLFSVVLKPSLIVDFFQKLVYFRNAI